MAENAAQVTTGTCRISFPNLDKPREQKGGEPKFGVMLLIPKTDKATLRKLKAAEAAALESGKGKFGGKVPKVYQSIIKDGDEAGVNYDPEDWPEREGCMFMSVRSATRPGLVGRKADPRTGKPEKIEPYEFYSGCYVRAAIGAFAFNTDGNKGVSFGLNHLQFWADGERLDGSTNAEDVFEADDDDDEDDDLI